MRSILVIALSIAAMSGFNGAASAQSADPQPTAAQRAGEVHYDCVIREARAKAPASKGTDTAVASEVKRLCANEEKRWTALAVENTRRIGGDTAITRKQIARQAYLNAEDEVRAARGKRARSGRE
jgi:hypothetical protein